MYHSIPEVHARSYKFADGDAAVIAEVLLWGDIIAEGLGNDDWRRQGQIAK